MKQTKLYSVILVLALSLSYSCTRTSKRTITTSDGFKYIEITKSNRKSVKKGVLDMNGCIIVPIEMSEILYQCNTSSINSCRGCNLDPEEFRRFLCKFGNDKQYTESYKTNGECVISHERGYQNICLDSYVNKYHSHLLYIVTSKDDLIGVCDSDGKEIVHPVFNKESFNRTIIEEKNKYHKNELCTNLLFQDHESVYDSNGKCIIAALDNYYISIGAKRLNHPDKETDNYLLFCRRNDMGTDIRSPKGKLICSSDGSAYLSEVSNNKSDTYYYIVCSSGWDSKEPYRYESDYYKYSPTPRSQETPPYCDIEEKDDYSIYDIYGNYICSIKGAYYYLDKDGYEEGRAYPFACRVNYDERRGFYKKRAGFDENNDRWYFYNEDNVYINKWLDENLCVTNVNPNPTQFDTWNYGMGLGNCLLDSPSSIEQYEWTEHTGIDNPIQPHQHESYCMLCGGSGKCSTCNGKGWYYGFGGSIISCPNCTDGTCPSCHGTCRKTKTEWY